MIWLATQPSKGRTFEKLGIKAIGLRPTLLSGDRNACRVDHTSLDAARLQPARQLEPVTPRLEGNNNSFDLAAGLNRLLLPALYQCK